MVVDTSISSCTAGMNATLSTTDYPVVANCFCPVYLQSNVAECTSCLQRNSMTTKLNMLQTLRDGCTNNNVQDVGRTIGMTLTRPGSSGSAPTLPAGGMTPGLGGGSGDGAVTGDGGVTSVGNASMPVNPGPPAHNAAGRTVYAGSSSAIAILLVTLLA
jgi:hypothetical protein